MVYTLVVVENGLESLAERVQNHTNG